MSAGVGPGSPPPREFFPPRIAARYRTPTSWARKSVAHLDPMARMAGLFARDGRPRERFRGECAKPMRGGRRLRGFFTAPVLTQRLEPARWPRPGCGVWDGEPFGSA